MNEWSIISLAYKSVTVEIEKWQIIEKGKKKSERNSEDGFWENHITTLSRFNYP